MRPIETDGITGPVLRPGEALTALTERDQEILKTILAFAVRDGSSYSAHTPGEPMVRAEEIGVLRNQFVSSDFSTK